MKLTRLFIICSLALSLPLYAQTQTPPKHNQIMLHSKKREAVFPLMPIEKTVTLFPAIAPQDYVSIVAKPAISKRRQIIILPPESINTIRFEQDKDALPPRP